MIKTSRKAESSEIYTSTHIVCEMNMICKGVQSFTNLLLNFRFNTYFVLPVTLMLSFLILVSGKNIEYSQAVGKRCMKVLHKFTTCGQNS